MPTRKSTEQPADAPATEEIEEAASEPSPSPKKASPISDSSTPSPDSGATMPAEAAVPFDTKPFIMRLGGKEYLPVSGRVAWFRYEYPHGEISTKLQEHMPGEYAVFSAFVSKGDGLGTASGYGSETKGDFKDYLEKAETKALGRALAALGYGFDHDEGGSVVDTPRPAQQQRQSAPPAQRQQAPPAQRARTVDQAIDAFNRQHPDGINGGPPDGMDLDVAAVRAGPPPSGQAGLAGGLKPGDKPMLPKQWEQIIGLLKAEGTDPSEELVQDAVLRIYNTVPDFLTQAQAADFIHRLSESVEATLTEGEAPEQFEVLDARMAELLSMRAKACRSAEELEDWTSHIKTRFKRFDGAARPFLEEIAELTREWGLTPAGASA